ncbi:hypothetical protein L7F22_054415 [Adiantum nelumboides]|nr:hypothetical protein [Adiantum nelumboides]
MGVRVHAQPVSLLNLRVSLCISQLRVLEEDYHRAARHGDGRCQPWCRLPSPPLVSPNSLPTLLSARSRLPVSVSFSEPGFANGLFGGFGRIARRRVSRASTLGEFFSLLLLLASPLTSAPLPCSFGPILFKQVPYTMAKFYFFEIAFEALVKATGKQKEQLSSGAITGLNLTGGVISVAAPPLSRSLPTPFCPRSTRPRPSPARRPLAASSRSPSSLVSVVSSPAWVPGSS